jgi:hypothetical protein
MTIWTQKLARLFSRHSDAQAVVRAGRKAKRRTNRRDRHRAKAELREESHDST